MFELVRVIAEDVSEYSDVIGETGRLTNSSFCVAGYEPIEFVRPKRRTEGEFVRVRTALGNTFVFRRAS